MAYVEGCLLYIKVAMCSTAIGGLQLSSIIKFQTDKAKVINGDAADGTFVLENVSDLVDDVVKARELTCLACWLYR